MHSAGWVQPLQILQLLCWSSISLQLTESKMRMLSSSIFLCAVISCTRAMSIAPSMTFAYNASLAADDIFNMFWSVNGDKITIEVHAKTLGYVGFGLSKTGGMKHADIVMGWVKDGEVFFQDRYSSRNTEPEIDESQDWKILEGREEGEYTILKFTRELTNCDPFDIDITDETIRIIYSYHTEDPEESTGLMYHGSTRRGTKSMILISHLEEEDFVLPKDAIFMDFKVENIPIPATDTTYYCQGFKVPTLSQKHHVTMVEPLIKSGNEGLVHHMILYACSSDLDVDANHGLHDDCEHERMEAIQSECYMGTYIYAIGTGNTYLPIEAGVPLGDGNSSTFFRLEIHYDNPPPSPSGLVDSSGMRLWLTPTLRTYDASMLTTGLAANKYHIIPPYFDRMTNHGYCGKACLSKGMEGSEDTSKGIQVFGVALHSHLLGVNLKLRHFRNGVELPPIAKDDHYDFNYQYMKMLKKPVTVMPEDDLIAECSYNSEKRENITFGGKSTKEEMCLVFISYYPKMSTLSNCLSMNIPSNFMKYTGAKIIPSNDPNAVQVIGDGYTGKSWYEIVASTDWTDEKMRDSFQKVLKDTEASQVLICDAMQDGFSVAKPMEITKLYEDTDSCKGTDSENQSPGSPGSSSLANVMLMALMSLTAFLANNLM